MDLNPRECNMQSKGQTVSLHYVTTFGSARPEARAFHLALILLVLSSSLREYRSGLGRFYLLSEEANLLPIVSVAARTRIVLTRASDSSQTYIVDISFQY